MKVLITGSAGFIGFFLAKALLARGDSVVGIDNLNGYYDPALKRARLQNLKQFVQAQQASVIRLSRWIWQIRRVWRN